jgi:hypothetical protein
MARLVVEVKASATRRLCTLRSEAEERPVGSPAADGYGLPRSGRGQKAAR